MVNLYDDDPVRARIAQHIKERGLQMAKISRALDKNPTYIQQYLTKGSPRTLPEEIREGLAEILEIAPDELRKSRKTPGSTTFPSAQARIDIRPSEFPQDVPIRATEVVSDDGGFEIEDRVIGFTDRLPKLRGAKDAYALYVPDDSMADWREAGSIVHVHPDLPVVPGNYAVVYVRQRNPNEPDLAYIRRYEGATGANERFRTGAAAGLKDVLFPRSRIRAKHRIMDWPELMGA